MELFKCISLCHQVRHIIQKNQFESNVADEVSVLNFSKICYHLFDRSNRFDNPSEYSVKFRSKRLTYQILGINEYTRERKRFSLVQTISPQSDNLILDQDNKNKFYLLVKGDEESMIKRLNLNFVEQ